MEASLDLGLFLEPGAERLFFLAACLRRSFSSMTWRMHSRCRASFSRCISRTSASVRRGGDCIMMGEDEALELAMLWLSSSKGSDRRRSSSERKEVARSSRSNSESDSRLGHEGKAHEASRELRRLEGLMSMAADMALIELYELYEPYIVCVRERVVVVRVVVVVDVVGRRSAVLVQKSGVERWALSIDRSRFSTTMVEFARLPGAIDCIDRACVCVCAFG